MLSIYNNDEYQQLNELAIKFHSDKSSLFHNYTEVYARYLASLKNKPIKFLEIGIWKGESVKLWENYFPQAELHFIDITFEYIEYFSERSHYHLANQESILDLQKCIASIGGSFDVIIDDGGHTMHQQITSFEYLFPHIKTQGVYFIEDLHTSYWPQFQGVPYKKANFRSLRKTTVEYLKMLIDELNFVGSQTACANHVNLDPAILKKMNLYREKIESIHFYDSLAAIIKRGT